MKVGKWTVEAISLADQVKEVEREIELRWRVYPRWVAAGRLTESVKDKRIATLIAVRDRLRAELAREAKAGELPL